MILDFLVKNYIKILLSLILIGAALFWLMNTQGTRFENRINSSGELPGFKTNTAKKSVELGKLLSGGPGKDGIPAIRDPQFTQVTAANFPDDSQGILIALNGEQRFYPYNIMIWHEIVNDAIGNNHFAVTFCPLCGSAIVFDRKVGGDILEFGVSGLLYESNLVMYDDKTESLWSQSRGEAIVGDYTGTKLAILPFQVISMGDLRKRYASAKVLSRNTGHARNYNINPYSNYDSVEEIYFPVSKKDERFPLKEVMFIIPFNNKSIAMNQINLRNGQSSNFEIEGESLTAVRNGEELEVRNSSGEILPGYYEMWFSWAIHHQENGIVWEIK